MLAWILVVELMLPGQPAAPVGIMPGYHTEAECRDNLARIARGEYTTVFTDDGAQLRIVRGITCIVRTVDAPATS